MSENGQLGLDGLKQLCGGGRCPRVFLTPEGDFLVQGILADPMTRSRLDPLDSEEIVRLPKDVVEELIRNLKAQ